VYESARRREVMALYGGETKERDLSWLDYSYPADLSSDGKTILFDEEGVGGGVQYGNTKELTYEVYIRNTDGSPAIRLGEGGANALSPDQKWVIVQTPGVPNQLRLLPTGAGETQPLTNDSINHQWDAGFLTASASSFPATSPGVACACMCRMCPQESRRQFRQKEWTQPPSQSRQMARRS